MVGQRSGGWDGNGRESLFRVLLRDIRLSSKASAEQYEEPFAVGSVIVGTSEHLKRDIVFCRHITPRNIQESIPSHHIE